MRVLLILAPSVERRAKFHADAMSICTEQSTMVAVYSVGAMFMAAFPGEHRFLTRGTRLMIHEGSMTSTVPHVGPLSTLSDVLRAKLHEIDHSIMIQEEGFRDLICGSNVAFDDLKARAPSNGYIEAQEARDLGLVLDVI